MMLRNKSNVGVTTLCRAWIPPSGDGSYENDAPRKVRVLLEQPVSSRNSRCHRRGGYLYVAVLFTSLLVATIVAGALAASTSRLRRTNDRVDRVAAIQLAESELHLQATRMQTSLAWRSSLAHSQFSVWRNLLGGQVRHRFFDTDNSLMDDSFDPVTLTVHARVNGAEVTLSTEMVSRDSPLSLLNYSVTALDDLQIDNDMHLAAESPVQVVDDCKTTSRGLLVAPKLEYGDQLSVTVRGDLGPSNVVGPPNDMIARYAAVGTAINISSIPNTAGFHIIENNVLSGTNNPYGSVDASGVYRINGNNKDLVIRNCRIEGTLVTENCKTVRVTGAVVWNSIDPARAALISTNTIVFDAMELQLNESVRNTNFNPSHTPSRGGISNSTKIDSFPTVIRGVIYSLQDINLLPMAGNERLHIAGTLIATDINVTGRISVTSLPELLARPPLGFRDPVPMQFVHGSLRRIVTP